MIFRNKNIDSIFRGNIYKNNFLVEMDQAFVAMSVSGCFNLNLRSQYKYNFLILLLKSSFYIQSLI